MGEWEGRKGPLNVWTRVGTGAGLGRAGSSASPREGWGPQGARAGLCAGLAPLARLLGTGPL